MSLHTGSMILAVIHIIEACVIITVALLILSEKFPIFQLDGDMEQNEKIRFLSIGAVVLSVNSIVFTGFKIYGSKRKNPAYVFPFVALEFGYVVGAVTSCVTSIISLACFPPEEASMRVEELTHIIELFFVSAIFIYIWLITFSHYKELVDEQFEYRVKSDGSKVCGQPLIKDV